MTDRPPSTHSPTSPSSQAASPGFPVVDLRILATTDLHMHMDGRDDFAGRDVAGRGIAAVAPLIHSQRDGHPNSLLFDNGDLLHGHPVAAFLDSSLPHPMIAAMNALGYDGATLGNHDFDGGLSVLRRAVSQARFGFVASNARVPGANGSVAPFLMLDRTVRDRSGATHPMRIGVVGFLPPLTAADDPRLAKSLRLTHPVAAARALIPALRASGADLIVALCHGGIGAPDTGLGKDADASGPEREHLATDLALLDGIDAVIAGHAHLSFPGPDHEALGPWIDPGAGTLSGKPAVMPGFWGSHLGVIDLVITREGPDSRWRIAEHRANALPTLTERPAPLPVPVSLTLHSARSRMARPVARTKTPLTTYLALVGHDPATRLVAQAQAWAARRALRGRAGALPILSSASPGRAGGRGGPLHYTDIAAGPITRLDLHDLCPWDNSLRLIQISGADALDWLERAASIFARLVPGERDQPLLDPEFPSYNFDVLQGLTWRIDPSAPARYAPDGTLIDPAARRVAGLSHRGRPVAPTDRFLLATHSFRFGAGLYAGLTAGRPAPIASGPPVRDVLRRYLARRRRIEIATTPVWRFTPLPGTTAILPVGAGALAHLDAAPVPCAPDGTTPAGFVRLKVSL